MIATVNDVILAEDDADDVYIFRIAVKETTFPIIIRHAADGEKLLELLKEQIPDILFLDIQMPCKDGAACIVEIRKNREYDNMPVIMYSALTLNKYIDHCFENGANFFLPKTGSLETLVSKLKYLFTVDWKTYLHYPPKEHFVLSA
jgi:CheY-like chemotaxis protein